MAKQPEMTCDEVQHKIRNYLDHALPLEEEARFVEHVRGCRECREEAEAYYAFYSALSKPGGEEEESFRFDLEKRLERTEAAVAKAKKDYRVKKLAYVVIALLAAAAVGVSFGV